MELLRLRKREADLAALLAAKEGELERSRALWRNYEQTTEEMRAEIKVC